MQVHKILWSEGMILHPQHFQQWEAYQQQQLWQFFQARWQAAWGLSELKYDSHSLTQGRLEVTHCQAMLLSGIWLNYDAQYQGPLKLDLTQQRQQKIYLKAPINHRAQGITGYPDSQKNPRWQAEYIQIPDAHNPIKTKEILSAHINLSLTTEYNPQSTDDYLLLGQIDFDARRGFYFNPEILPVCLNLKASPGFSYFISHLRQQWESILANSQASIDKNIILKQSLARLRYFYQQPIVSPQALFQLLYELALTLNINFEFDYDHRESGCCLYTLAEHLKTQLPAIYKPVTTLGFEQVHEHCFSTSALDTADLQKYQWIIGIKLKQAEIDGHDILPCLKVASSSNLENLVRQALPGLRLKHLFVPPEGVPVNPDYYYYLLIPEGEIWQQILLDKQILLFIQSELSPMALALYRVE